MRSLVLLVVVALAPLLMAPTCGGDDTPAYVSPLCLSHPGQQCISDLDCSDGVFCNGVESCSPSRAGADGCGCLGAAVPTPCGAEQTCSEALRRCDYCTTDADSDGHRSMDCHGDDCDDNDPNRFPGRMEVCDALDHDEDCDAATFGEVDADGDQFMSGACCNVDNGGVRHCGTDCDDANPAIVPGAQKCFKDGSTNVLICQLNGAFSALTPCGSAQTCTEQPNGLGVCHL
jgi:hypothetical protein